MAENSAISWTNHTFNLWEGCAHAPNPDGTTAPECDNCYAETRDKRHLHGPESHWGEDAPRRFFDDDYWGKLRRWDRKAKADGVRARVFVGSICDWAEVHRNPEIAARQQDARMRLWREIRLCPSLDILLLTKRPRDAAKHLPWNGGPTLPEPFCRGCADSNGTCDSGGELPCDPREPWPRVWLGTSCGHPSSLYRIDDLRAIRAAVRFVSAEPLLPPAITADQWNIALGPWASDPSARIHWLIAGDEDASAAKRRPIDLDAVRVARDAAARHGVTFHFKQWCGGDAPGLEPSEASLSRKRHLPILDNVLHNATPRTR